MIKSPNAKPFLFSITIFILGLSGIYITYNVLGHLPIRSDGVGYYIYLPAIFINHDITLQTLALEHFKGNIPSWTGAIIYQNSNAYLIKYPVGEAIMMSPFFFIAYLLSLLFGLQLDAFSPIFQYSAAISGLFYMSLGLFILWKVMSKYFQGTSILIALFGIVFATNLFNYATFDSVFSHSYSFFLISSLFYIVQHIYTEKSSLYFLFAGLSVGLIIIVRPTNVLIFIYLLFYGIHGSDEIKERICFFKNNIKNLFLFFLSLFFILGFQILYWKMITGHYIVYSYQGESFDFLHPEIFNILFSSRKGLFFWAPILLTIFPGLYCLRRKAPDFFLPTILYLPLMVYITSSWWSWWYGGTFGSRPFVETLPIFALGLASLYESVRPLWRKVLVAFIVIFITLSMFLMHKLWIGTIPLDGVTLTEFVGYFKKNTAMDKPLNNPKVKYELSLPYDKSTSTIIISVTNIGNEIWHAGHSGKYGLALSYKLDNNQANVHHDYGNKRFLLPYDVMPNETVPIKIHMDALAKGDNIITISMVQELVAWFHDKGNKTLSVKISKEDKN